MIRLFVVGDGERDCVCLPVFVGKLISRPIESETRSWARLGTGGRGYSRKLLFAVRTAITLGHMGVIATVDRDREHKLSRLGQLKEGRAKLRADGEAMPVALGEAIPHGEAWLFHDPSAIRIALKLASDYDVPTITKIKNPKRELEKLFESSERKGDRPLKVWVEIAESISLDRCNSTEETGFSAFMTDVGTEFSHVTG